jgi:DNA mismatch repair ATPase MutS
MEAKQFYENRIETLTAVQKVLQQRKSIFGILRLGTMLAIFAAFYFLWSLNKFYAFAAAIILTIIFIQLIYKDLANKAAIKHLQQLININTNELNALEGKYNQFEDGAHFTPHDHFYANDMDIFGRASLYQFLNRTTSEIGSEKLAGWLLNPSIKETILQRQAAVKELATKTNGDKTYKP